MIVNFGAYSPDLPNLGNPCITARNVIPQGRGYKPLKTPTSISDALAAACKGAFSVKRVDGTVDTFAGTSTKLYKFTDPAWDEVTRTSGGDYSATTNWRFTLFGSRVVAANGIDATQKFDLGTDTDFAALTNAPVADAFIVVRDVLVGLNTTDDITFSAVNDSEKWTQACGGGTQPVPDGGPIVGGTGGEFGTILQEHAITRMNFVGGNLRFTFDRVEGAIGCIAGGSIVEHKGRTFYLSEEGFQVFNGAESVNISTDRITETFFDELDRANIDTMSVGLDPKNSIIIWSYPTSSTRKLLLYNYASNRWADSDQILTCLHTSQETSTQIGGFDSSNDLVQFTGAALSAILSTGEIELFPGFNATVLSARGLVDADHDVYVGTKRHFGATEEVQNNSSENGKVLLRANGKYHRFELRPTEAWTEITGIDVEAKRNGKRT
ncbi:hypothetical protein GWO43_16040 [candidate division KSB1 bacterium]|nr:hypothetical protein [candidate division KSB1 bacterium]NIV68743.1 hypothetical protein [Phycisphaerae bacterium]NIS25462.1 hypothetical protein [candidate division KSB1 bacterium]NIT72354.1 hypothetical protein [candidate division KSB1 bacterium]NIU26139.1 hypothetical protein [candidate division KSB1 bacterium]